MMGSADRYEARTGRPSKRADLTARLIGRYRNFLPLGARVPCAAGNKGGMALEPLNAGRPQTATGRILVGTSGWSYRHWRGSFFPERLAGNGTLAYYAARFATVEIDRTFSSLPEPVTIERWRDTVPAGFTFAVKAPREITHLERLRRSEATLSAFLDRVRGLQRALGPILFQLPEGFPRHRSAAQLPGPAAARPDLCLRVSR